MKQPKILVTGATGRTGSAVVDELLAKGVPVRALVHSKDARSAALKRKGAETVVADMFGLDQLLAARGFRNNCTTLRRPAGSPEKFHQLATHVC